MGKSEKKVVQKHAEPFDRGKAFELYQKGYSDRMLSEACDAERTLIGAWRRRLGLPPNPSPVKGEVPPPPSGSSIGSYAAAARAAGMSYGEYMSRYGKK